MLRAQESTGRICDGPTSAENADVRRSGACHANRGVRGSPDCRSYCRWCPGCRWSHKSHRLHLHDGRGSDRSRWGVPRLAWNNFPGPRRTDRTQPVRLKRADYGLQIVYRAHRLGCSSRRVCCLRGARQAPAPQRRLQPTSDSRTTSTPRKLSLPVAKPS